MFQAATQINEMTLSFIPKLIVTVLTLMIAGPWLLNLVIEYTRDLIQNIPYLIG
jgi:flagellar biosynthetic protein FliQ